MGKFGATGLISIGYNAIVDRIYPTDDFDAVIRFYSPENGGRETPPFNGTRWDFAYAEDGLSNVLWHIYPDFYLAGGDSLPLEGPLPVGIEISARMTILDDDLCEKVHRLRIKPGVRFYCHEGGKRVAEGEVTRITGLFDPRPKSVSGRVRVPATGDARSVVAMTEPNDPEMLDPYQRFRRMGLVGMSVGGAIFLLLKTCQDACVILPALTGGMFGLPVFFYFLWAERQRVKRRMRAYRWIAGRCPHCGGYQSDKTRKRCLYCFKLLDAKPSRDC